MKDTKQFKSISDLGEWIANSMATAKTAREKKPLRDSLAYQIYGDPHLVFLLLAKSSFTEDERLILGRVNKMAERDQALQEKATKNYVIDPMSMKGAEDQFPGSDFDLGPIATPEQERAIRDLYAVNPTLDQENIYNKGTGLINGFDKDAPWIQTYSGRRFNPTKPNPDAIVIQDIAHALSMQCRFSGHCQKFYSVAQHSVLVSHVCNFDDALWGLMHDASEAYLVDVPRPLKQSGLFNAYLEFEDRMQKAICKRFGLPEKEPPSVKRADTILLATEARDLMSPLHPDWKQPVEALPFRIESWGPEEAKKNFLKRFAELTGQNSK
jgi:uncharacterized protein